VDVDLSDVAPKDSRIGNHLHIIAKRFKFGYELRDDVFTPYGLNAAQTEVPNPVSDYCKLGDMIARIVRPLKCEGDTVLVMVGDDGVLVITTAKYKDGPAPPDVVRKTD
jgi:hypothetical protein